MLKLLLLLLFEFTFFGKRFTLSWPQHGWLVKSPVVDMNVCVCIGAVSKKILLGGYKGFMKMMTICILFPLVCGINSILYQRGIYPPETFSRLQKYGLTLLVSTDPELNDYLNKVVEQLKDWLYKCQVQKLVVVITSIDTNEILERWQFDIECDKSFKDDNAVREKSPKVIQEEIRSVIRQITATVTFLPLLEASCAFDLLIYTDKDLDVPEKWEESGPQFVSNSEEVRLRSFTTTIHKVNSMVAYKKIES